MDHSNLIYAGVNLYELMNKVQNQIISSKEPNELITGINELRNLMKHQTQLFFFIFSNLYEKLPAVILNENDKVSHDCLIFLNDLFSKSWLISEDDISDIISTLLPPILKLTVIDTNSIVSGFSQDCIDNMDFSWFCKQTFITLLEEMSSKDDLITSKASELLFKFLTKIDKQDLISNFDWDYIFEKVQDVFVTKQQLAVGFIDTLKNDILTIDQFELILSEANENNLENLIYITEFSMANVIKKKKGLIV